MLVTWAFHSYENIPDKSDLRKKGFIFTYGLGKHSLSWQGRNCNEDVRHLFIASAVKKQREIYSTVQFAFSLKKIQYGTLAHEIVASLFPSQLHLSRNIIKTCPEVCLVGGAKLSQADKED